MGETPSPSGPPFYPTEVFMFERFFSFSHLLAYYDLVSAFYAAVDVLHKRGDDQSPIGDSPLTIDSAIRIFRSQAIEEPIHSDPDSSAPPATEFRFAGFPLDKLIAGAQCILLSGVVLERALRPGEGSAPPSTRSDGVDDALAGLSLYLSDYQERTNVGP